MDDMNLTERFEKVVIENEDRKILDKLKECETIEDFQKVKEWLHNKIEE